MHQLVARLSIPRVVTLTAALLLFAGCGDDGTTPTLGGGRVCTSFERYVRLLSRVDATDTNRAVRRGDVVYLADGAGGVQVILVSDATQPLIVSTAAIPGEPVDIAVDENLLYVATRSDGVYIYDLSNPLLPSEVGHHSTAGQSLGIAVSDTLLYVANDGLGLLVISVRDPSDPRQIGGENTPGVVQDVVVSGDMAYLSDATLGLRVVSILVPSDPMLLNTLPIPGEPRGIDLKDDALYIASSSAGLQIVDIGDPDSPSIAGTVLMPGGVRDVTVHDDRAYAADRFSGVQVLDVTDPLAPSITASVAVLGEALGVNTGGDLLFVCGGSRMSVVEISNPNSPPVASIVQTPGAEALGVSSVGEAVYVCDGSAGVQIVNVDDATSPVFVGNIDLNGAQHAVVEGSIAYITGQSATLQVDVGDPFAPDVLTSAMAGGLRVAAKDTLVFLAQGRDGVSVYRAVAQGDVRFVQNINAASLIFAHDVVVAQDHAYVAWGISGVQIIDPSRLGGPLFPVVATFRTSTATKAIAVYDHYLLLLTLAGLEIVDIQTPRAPALVSTLELPGQLSLVTTNGQTAYIAAQSAGFHVVDLFDPVNPVLVGSLHTGGKVMGVAATPSSVYAADSERGLITTDAQCE
jgi:hypothetical protein